MRTPVLRIALLVAGVAASVAAATATSALAGAPSHHTFFESPSRNIGCVMIDATARCDILQRSWSPPARPRNCPHVVDFGQGLVVGTKGPAALVCAGDTAMNASAPILAYGSSNTIGELRCSSATSGITCRSSRSGHGFFISRQRYTIF